MKKLTELQNLIREEIRKIVNEENFTVFGGVHSDKQLTDMEDTLQIYKSKDPIVWEKYIKTLVAKGYNKSSHKEHPHYQWAVKRLSKLK